MTKKKPNVIITFSDEKKTLEEQNKEKAEFVYALMRWYKTEQENEEMNKKFDSPSD